MSAAPGSRAPAPSPYELRLRVEVLALLAELMDRREPVLLEAEPSGQSLVTRVLAVDARRERLILDGASTPEGNQALVAAESLAASARLRRVEIRFRVPPARLVALDGGPALAVRIPASVVRLQRRDHFRVRTPAARPLVCRVPDPADPGRRVDARLVDLSAGGVCLVSLPWEIRPGARLERCEVELPDLATVVVGLEVRYVTEDPALPPPHRRRYGCRFVDVPPEVSMLLQRCVDHIERMQSRARGNAPP